MNDDSQEKDESIVEGVVDDLIPGMGRMVKGLRKRSPEFDKKIAEKEEEIKKRLEEGYSPEPEIRSSIRVRSLAPGREEKKEEIGHRPRKATIEPVVDVFDEGSTYHIIAELPGVEESRIETGVSGTTLTISARDKDRAYRKAVPFPTGVRIAKQRFHNGVLELTLEKTDD